jgi:putative oxidoreductase
MNETIAAWTPRVLSVLRAITGLMIIQHGMAKIIGFPATPAIANVQPQSLVGISGLIELTGGALLILGLLTRPAAFILAGQMGVGYFIVHAPTSFFPLLNGGSLAIMYCFTCLYLSTAGAGPWSLDAAMQRDWGTTIEKVRKVFAAWEPMALSLFRVVTGLLFFQFGVAKLFKFPPVPFFAKVEVLSLFGIAGIFELVLGGLLILGFRSRLVAFILSGEMATAYFIEHLPQGFIPLLNNGSLAIMFCFACLYLACIGGGPWSFDTMTRRKG